MIPISQGNADKEFSNPYVSRFSKDILNRTDGKTFIEFCE
jgi:hypothetical protein